jgi:hypothetical protein
MVSLFSKLIDCGVECQLRKGPNGDLVFLPFGSRKRAYFVDSQSDADKIKAFVKMYRGAGLLISWMYIGGMSIFGHYLTFYPGAGAIPLRTRMLSSAWPVSAYMLLMFIFVWILWGLYRQAIPALTSSLREAEPDVNGQLAEVSAQQRRVVLVCVAAGLILMGLVFLTVQPRCRKPHPAPGQVCGRIEVDSTSQNRPRS